MLPFGQFSVFLPTGSATLVKGIRACPQVNYREPTPPEQDLVLRSTVVKVKDYAEKIGSGKPSVQVDISLFEVRPLSYIEQDTAKCSPVKKVALRAVGKLAPLG